MNTTRLLSVVVPAYNTEKYIGRCLESLCNQTLDSAQYEVIVVNDGSQDKLEHIVHKYQNKYPQIKYIVQYNKRSGGARNTGIQASCGKYIIFVDSDDYVQHKNTLEILTHNADLHSVDVLWGNAYFTASHDSDYGCTCYTKPVNISIYSGKDAMHEQTFSYAVWQFVINREFINQTKLLFREGVYYEDSDFTAKLLYYAKRVGIIDFPYYVYCYNEASSTNTPSLEVFVDNCKSSLVLNTFVKEYVTELDVQIVLRDKIKKALLSYLKISRKYRVKDSLTALSVIRSQNVMCLSSYSCSKYELLQLAAMKYCPFFTFHSVRMASLLLRFIRSTIDRIKRPSADGN